MKSGKEKKVKVNRKDAILLHKSLKKAYGEEVPNDPRTKCLRCGICCELEPPTLWYPELGKPCRYLARDENGLASCLLYGTDKRPRACTLYGWNGFEVCPVGQVYWGKIKL